MELANVTFHREPVILPNGLTERRIAQVHWDGPKTLPFTLDDIAIRGESLPFPYRKIERIPGTRLWLCMRTDTGRPWALWACVIRLWWHRLYLKERIIETCAIWGAARVESGTLPQWRDIYVIAAVQALASRLISSLRKGITA